MTSGWFLRYLLFCSRKSSGCFSRYLFLCSCCFRFISVNSMRGSFLTLSSSTSVLSSCVLSSFTTSFKVPSSWTFKKLVKSYKPSLLFCHLENGLKLRVKPRFTCWGFYTRWITKDDGKMWKGRGYPHPFYFHVTIAKDDGKMERGKGVPHPFYFHVTCLSLVIQPMARVAWPFYLYKTKQPGLPISSVTPSNQASKQVGKAVNQHLRMSASFSFFSPSVLH